MRFWSDTYGIDFEIPWLSGCVKINNNLLEWQSKLLEGNVCAVRVGAAVVGVEDDLWGRHRDQVIRSIYPGMLGLEVVEDSFFPGV